MDETHYLPGVRAYNQGIQYGFGTCLVEGHYNFIILVILQIELTHSQNNLLCK